MERKSINQRWTKQPRCAASSSTTPIQFSLWRNWMELLKEKRAGVSHLFIVGYGWGPALCAAELHFIDFQSTPFRHLCLFMKWRKKKASWSLSLLIKVRELIEKKKRNKLVDEGEMKNELNGRQTYNQLLRNLKSFTFQWRRQSTIQLHFHSSTNSNKRKLLFFICLIHSNLLNWRERM